MPASVCFARLCHITLGAGWMVSRKTDTADGESGTE